MHFEQRPRREPTGRGRTGRPGPGSADGCQGDGGWADGGTRTGSCCPGDRWGPGRRPTGARAVAEATGSANGCPGDAQGMRRRRHARPGRLSGQSGRVLVGLNRAPARPLLPPDPDSKPPHPLKLLPSRTLPHGALLSSSRPTHSCCSFAHLPVQPGPRSRVGWVGEDNWAADAPALVCLGEGWGGGLPGRAGLEAESGQTMSKSLCDSKVGGKVGLELQSVPNHKPGTWSPARQGVRETPQMGCVCVCVLGLLGST